MIDNEDEEEYIEKEEPQIIWEKWYSPFGEDDVDIKDEIMQDMMDQLNQAMSQKNEEYLDNELDFQLSQSPKNLGKQQKYMMTPMGVMPVTENTESSKIFNFWTGHTNFDICQIVASTIEKCEGVESFDVFTRYRFRISVGKAFKDSDVMSNINEKVYEIL